MLTRCRRVALLFLIAAAGVRPSRSSASTDVIVHGPADVGAQSDASIAINAAGTILIAGYNEPRGFDVTPLSISGVSRSSDGGTTWNEVPVGPGGLGVVPSTGTGQVFGHPDVKYDPTRDLFFYASIYVRPSDFLQGICLHVSNSGVSAGTSWAGPIEIAPTFVFANSADAPFIDVNTTTGRIVLTWTSFANPGTSQIRRTYSDDGGTNWATSLTIANAPMSSTFVQNPIPRILSGATNPTSTVYAVWSNGGATTRNIGCSRSADGGVTWSMPVDLDSSSFAPEDQVVGVDRVFSSPSLAVDSASGRVYVVYQRNSAVGTGDIALRTFTGTCVTGSPVMLDSNPGADRAQFSPWVTVDPSNGKVHVIWYDQDAEGSGDVTEVMHTVSADGGVTWSRPTPLNDRPFHAGYGNDVGQPNIGDYIQSVAKDGKLHTVFTATSVAPRFDEGQPSLQLVTPDVYYDSRLDTTDAASLRLTGVSFTENGCTAPNGNLDPGEGADLTLALENYVANAVVGAATITSVSAALATSTLGVSVTGASSSYPSLAPLATASNSTPFAVFLDPSFVPGTYVDFVLTVASDQGTIQLPFRLSTGTPGATTTLIDENFNGVSMPNLPAGWSSIHGAGTTTVAWTTSNILMGSNAAFHNEPGTASRWERLFSPTVTVPAVAMGVESYVTLDFDLAYRLEDEPTQSILAYDGLSLRITDMTAGATIRSVFAEAFAESFTTGSTKHFPKHLPRSSDANYFQDMSVWSGDSGGPVHVSMKLPGAGMTGRAVQLRFEYTEDSSGACAVAPCGVAIDNVLLKHVVSSDGFVSADVTAPVVTAPTIVTVTQTLCQ